MRSTTGRLAGVRYASMLGGSGSGYGDAADEYMAALRTAGVALSWTPMLEGAGTWGPAYGLAPFRGRHLPGARHADICNAPVDHDTLVLHLPPAWYGRWLEEEPDVAAVAMLAWETDVVPDDWPCLHPFALVVVPSSFTRDTLRRAGVHRRVEVVPHIARPVRPAPGGRFGQVADTDFVFYTIGTWSTRKALRDTIRAFLDAFTADDDVALVVKTTVLDHQAQAARKAQGSVAAEPRDMAWWTLATMLADYPRPPRLHLVTGSVASVEIDQLHTRGDCYLSLTRSEGWGLTSFDAGLFANPSVITGWGGHLDYLGTDYPLLVDYELVATASDRPDGWAPLRQCDHWARADASHAGTLMRWVYEHRHEAAALGGDLRSTLAARYSPERVTARLIELLAGVSH